MNILKHIGGFLLGLVVLFVSLVFPIVKIVLITWVVLYVTYIAFKYRNWTFIVPPVGGIMNLAAIALNGGKMPVLAAPGTVLDPTHVLMTSGTHVKLLCDIFPLFHLGLFSVGDITTAIIWPLTIIGYLCYRKYRKVTK